jgi:hypothetical protein
LIPLPIPLILWKEKCPRPLRLPCLRPMPPWSLIRRQRQDLFTSWFTYADNMERGPYECRVCYSSLCDATNLRFHFTQWHQVDRNGRYLRHQDGFKVVCPEPQCRWTFRKLFSLAVYRYRWHDWDLEISPMWDVEYCLFPLALRMTLSLHPPLAEEIRGASDVGGAVLNEDPVTARCFWYC